jgi:hypothetical protein
MLQFRDVTVSNSVFGVFYLIIFSFNETVMKYRHAWSGTTRQTCLLMMGYYKYLGTGSFPLKILLSMINMTYFNFCKWVAYIFIDDKKKVKQSRYTPWWRLGGEEV